MRDPNRKEAGQFVFSRYDTLGRKTAEGICASTWSNGCATGDSTSQVIEYTWDDASVGSAVSFTINNAKGRQTKVAFQGGYYLYSYDSDGHIERMYIKLDGLAGKTMAYTYDRQGNLTSTWFEKDDDDVFRHWYTYNTAGRLNLVRANDHASTQVTVGTHVWWPDGRLRVELQLGSKTNNHTYDARGRLTSINNTASSTKTFSAAYVWNPNSTLQISEYRQDSTIHTDKRYRHTFTYDGRNQMRTADYEYHNGSTWVDRYDFDIGQIYYDRDGGITFMNRQNGAEVVDFEYGYVAGSNRLDYVWNNEAFDLDADLSHDRNGNITNGRGISATTYDWRNLPLSITTSNPVYPFTPITHYYRYDHNGHRVYSSVDQTYTVRGAYGEPIAEYAGSTPAHTYWNYIRPDGVVTGRKQDGVRFYYERDHLGSTRTVFNQSGAVIETYDYMPFGEFMSGRITTSGTGTRPKFTGHAFDDETNLHTMHWRRQIPRYGVFRTPDPMADSYPGWNAYAYVMNDPMSYTDPTGLCPEDMWFGSVCKVWETYKQALINSLKSISAVPQNDSQEEIQRVSEEKKEARQVAHASTNIAEAVNQTMDVYSLFLPGYGAARAAVEGDTEGILIAGMLSIPIIRFGKVGNQTYHTFRHVKKIGLDEKTVEQAIVNDISSSVGSFPVNQTINRTVSVNGIDVTYSAHKLLDGVINVGRITTP